MCKKCLETKKKVSLVLSRGLVSSFLTADNIAIRVKSVTKREEHHKQTYIKKSEWDSRQHQFT